MLPEDSIAGWNLTDEQPVPVRSGNGVPKTSRSVLIDGPAADIRAEKPSYATAPRSIQKDERNMSLSAAIGICISLTGIVFYFGVDSLRGFLTADLTSGTHVVTITEDGHFDPKTIQLSAGDTLTINNSNPDPQVLKSKDDHDLFPVQVLFDKPFEFTVPEGSDGTYTYFSETLPDDQTLTITVGGTADVVAATQTDEIPLPFTDETASSQSIAGEQSASTATATIDHAGETATISISGTQTASSAPAATKAEIPVNPFTVAAGNNSPSAQIAGSAQKLHSGAPLITSHTPRQVSSTGMEGWLAVIPALGLMFVAFKRSIRLS
jgi:hypothetical protein